MDDVRQPKKILVAGVEGKRKRGRPRGRWLDSVRKDLEIKTSSLEIADRLAQDRIAWRRFIMNGR